MINPRTPFARPRSSVGRRPPQGSARSAPAEPTDPYQTDRPLPARLEGADDDREADEDDEERSDRDVDPVDAADPGELDEPALCPCGQGYVGHADHGLVVQVLAVEPPHGTVALLHAVTLPGEPCRVACEPRMAADIAERLAADGQPCYAVVERWQLL